MRGRASVGRGSLLLAGRPVHAGGGEGGERGVCWRETCPMRGRASAGREESAGGEICPCGGGRAWGGESAGDETCPCGEGRSLLAMRPVHAGEGGRGERGVCWR